MIKSQYALNEALLTCQINRPISQLIIREELPDDSVAKKEEC